MARNVMYPPVSSISGGQTATLTSERLPAWGLLLVFCSNRSHRIHRSELRRGTDRQTDGSQHCLIMDRDIINVNIVFEISENLKYSLVVVTPQ